MSSFLQGFDHLQPGEARTALAAIQARVDGVFDHPALASIGPLTADVLADVRQILSLATHHQLPATPKLVHVFPDTAPPDRIICTLTQQHEFRGHMHDGDDVEFDATAHVLAMRLEDIQDLQDYTPDVDDIALAHVSWDGPFRAPVTEHIAEFFEVDDVGDITQEMLDAKRAAYGIEPNDNEGMKP